MRSWGALSWSGFFDDPVSACSPARRVRGVKELVVLARLVFLELPLRKPRLRFETQEPRLKRLVGFLLLLLLLFLPPRPFDGPCTSSNMDRARNRLRRIRSTMSQSIAKHQAPAKLSSRSLLSTVFSSKFSSVFSSSSCTLVNISLKWFRLSVNKDLQVMTNALSRSLVNFALGGRTVESATRKFLVSCWSMAAQSKPGGR